MASLPVTSLPIGVIGAGAWGTALAHLLAEQGHTVRMWAYEAEVADAINRQRENLLFLPDCRLPASLDATTKLEDALVDRALVLVVCPSHVLRGVMTEAGPHLPPGVPIVTASKGIENESLLLMSEVLREVLPGPHHDQLAYLSGPSFAREVVNRMPTAVSIAAERPELAAHVQAIFSAPYFRSYTSTDVVGVELGGALKNVMAIAAGACDGLGFGFNTVSALVTRGLAEMNRLAMHRGANPLTLAGLAGMGDLVLTCMGGLSRNRTVGQRLGRGETLAQITDGMRTVAEGVRTARSAHELAKREGVDMPITSQVHAMLYEEVPAAESVRALMGRPLQPEIRS